MDAVLATQMGPTLSQSEIGDDEAMRVFDRALQWRSS